MLRSWDLFRTLAQARNGRAGEDSVENHYSIAENVSRMAAEDIVVSEYETERYPKARAILDRIGVQNKLIVTPCGKSDRSVWHELKAQGYEISEHIGDHWACDVEGPQSCGIKATQVTQHLSTEWGKQIESLGFPALAATIKEARLSTWDDSFRDLQLFQIGANFPFLFMVARALAAYAPIGRLLLSSRDCFLLHKLVGRFYPERDCRYFLTSRLARYQASDGYRKYVKECAAAPSLVVDLCGTGNSLKQYSDALIVVGMPGCCVPHLIDGGIDESSNFAPHPMVADVKDGLPVYANPLGIDWEGWPELKAMQQAFGAALDASRHYDWTADLSAPVQLDLTLRRMYEESGPLAQRFTEIRVKEARETAALIGNIEGVIV